MVTETKNTHQVSPISCVRGAILVPSGPDFRLREASLPWLLPPAAFATLLGLRGGSVAAPTDLMVGGTRGLHSADRMLLILLFALDTPGVKSHGPSGVWASG